MHTFAFFFKLNTGQPTDSAAKQHLVATLVYAGCKD
jgi:hypothetical protein